jgi:hypothetical protein
LPTKDSLLAKGSQSAEHADESNNENAKKLFAYDVMTKPKKDLLGVLAA